MSKECPFTLDDVIQSGLARSLNDDNIVKMDLLNIVDRPHSKVGVIHLTLKSGQEKDVFFKKGGIGETSDPPELLHRRETTVLNILYNNINRTLAPQLLGRVTSLETGTFLAFMEYLGEQSAHDDYLTLVQKLRSATTEAERLELEKGKLRLLRRDFRQIAKFNGKCRAYQTQFPAYFVSFSGTPEEAYEDKRHFQQERAFAYILRVIDYWELDGKEFQESEGRNGRSFNKRRVAKHVKQTRGINLRERLQDVFSSERAIKSRIRLQHGDCRAKHNFSGKLCDLEDFGYYPWYRDVVTYACGEIIALPIDQTPALLAHYLVYERAYGSKSKSLTLKELKELENMNEETGNVGKLLSRVNRTDFADFVIGYLSGVLVENDIIQDGIRKKYRREHLERELPGYSLDEIHTSKFRHIKEVFHWLTLGEGRDILSYCTNELGAKSYFFKLGNLLQELSRMQIENLGVLSAGSR